MTPLLCRVRRRTCSGSWRTYWQSFRGRRGLYTGVAPNLKYIIYLTVYSSVLTRMVNLIVNSVLN